MLDKLQVDWEICSPARLRTLLQSRGVLGVSAKRLKGLKRVKEVAPGRSSTDSAVSSDSGSSTSNVTGPVPGAAASDASVGDGGSRATPDPTPRVRTSAEIRACYQAAVDDRLKQLARLPNEVERKREARLEQMRQRIESLLINEAFEEDEAGMSEGMSDLLRSIAARKLAARQPRRPPRHVDVA